MDDQGWADGFSTFASRGNAQPEYESHCTDTLCAFANGGSRYRPAAQKSL